MSTNESVGPQIYERFGINAKRRLGLRDFVQRALEESGCTTIQMSSQNEAPIRVSFVAPWGERMGVVAYAFTANSSLTRNRPTDEHRFQVKYGAKDGQLHDLWQDPFGLYTTLFLGINVQRGFFVGADPVLNSPTRFFVSKEFKEEHARQIEARSWYAWPRQRRTKLGEPVEVLVGGTSSQFLRYVCFEREAFGEDQGHRQMLAEQFASVPSSELSTSAGLVSTASSEQLSQAHLHSLEKEFDLDAAAILEVIANAPRLKMAVRGWVAERHLRLMLEQTHGVQEVRVPTGDGRPDFEVRLSDHRRLVSIECKNVLRLTDKRGFARLDFMRTRPSQSDPCSRYYSPKDFDVVAACLHAQTGKWEFAARSTADMPKHARCVDKITNRQVVDSEWTSDLSDVLFAVADRA